MKYDAFISYRHLEKDMYVAKRVHKALESTKIPRKIQKEIGRKKINRVFRDQEELPIGSDLGENIEAALKEAGFLVVICSPETKDSYWVMKEIDTFISMHGRENILAVLVDGEPGDSFPEQILSDENGNPVEPLAADVRGNTKKEVNKKLKTETLRLAASILHIDYDDLKQRHREAKLRRNFRIAAAVGALAIAFGAYNTYNLARINENYQQKLINESKVLAATSLDVLEDGDRQTAALIAMEGMPSENNDRPLVSESVYALQQALNCYDISAEMRSEEILTHILNINNMAESIDGKKAITSDHGGYVYLWDLDTGEELFRLSPEYSEYGYSVTIDDIGFSDNAAVVINDNGVTGYDDEGNVLYQYVPKEGFYSGKVFQGRNIAMLNGEKYFEIIDLTTGDVVKSYENHLEEEYAKNFAYEKNGKYAAVSHEKNDEGIAYCTVYNLETDEYIDLEMKANKGLDMTFTDDGRLVMGLIDGDDLLSLSTVPMYVQMFDITTGQSLWVNEYTYETSFYNTSYTYTRNTNTTIGGEEKNVVIANGPKVTYVLDGADGTEINSIPSDSYIQRIGFNDDGSYIFMGTSNGKVTIYSTDPKYTLTDNEIVVDEYSLIDFDIQDGRLIATTYRSPHLKVMKYSKDESMLYDTEVENKISRIVDISPDGSTYLVYSLVTSVEEDSKYIYYVIDTETGEEKSSFTINEYNDSTPRYIDDDNIIGTDKKGNYYRFTISKDKLNKEKIVDDAISMSTYYTQNGKYLLYYNTSNYIVIDLDTFKKVEEGSRDYQDENGYFSEAILSENGKTIYYIDSENGYNLVKYSIKSGKSKALTKDCHVEQMTMSHDGTKIAIASDDAKLRVYDLASFTMEDEIDYIATSYSGLMQFSEDDNLLYLQGADLYFKIYDLIQKEFVFEFSNQSNEYDYCEYDRYNNRLIVSNFVGMSIIDLDSYGELSYIKHGRIYIPQKQMVVSAYGKHVYGFKFKSANELIEMANELYGDKELTTSQKLKYRIN